MFREALSLDESIIITKQGSEQMHAFNAYDFDIYVKYINNTKANIYCYDLERTD